MLTTERLCDLARVRHLAATGKARALREARGIALREMAEVVGCSPGSLSKWETGTHPPKAEAALRWGEVLTALEKAAVS